MGKDPGGHGFITVTLSTDGIEAIAAAVVRQLREGGLLQLATAVKENLPIGERGRIPASQHEAYFTEQEAAAYLTAAGVKYSPRTLQKQRITGGGIPFVKFKKRVRYRREDLETWLDSMRLHMSTSDTFGLPNAKR